MIVQLKKKELSESQLVKDVVKKNDGKINLLDFEAGLVYTHADMLSKSVWFNNKVDALRNNRK
jgi:hypothetical protein